jgi:GxxExxY protein
MNADHSDDVDRRLNVVTERIIGCAFEVSNKLGCGFLEKPYENAMAHLLKKSGLSIQQQLPVKIWFDGVIVGEYFADLVVENSVLVEIKAVKSFDEVHVAQCINYLKATGFPLCLLINFGRSRVEYRRYARTRGA